MPIIKLTKTDLVKKIKETINELLIGPPMRYRTMYDDIGDGLLVNEGLIHTYPLVYVEKFFRKRFSDDIIDKSFEYPEGMCIIVFKEENEKLEEVVKAMDRFGYYDGYRGYTEDGNPYIQFEPKFQNILTGNDIIENDLPFLWHVSPECNKEKIFKKGLSPVSKNGEFNYPGRVYLLLGSSTKFELYSMAEKLSATNKNKSNNGKYCVFKINLKGIENMKFNLDNNADNAVWTYDNIPPSNIEYAYMIDTNI